MKEDYNFENLPNAGKVISSLRLVGYDNISAIADLVDNSLDAGAQKIQLQIKPELEGYTIFLADNGCGMDKDVLNQALRLGSNTERDEYSDLGKFGMGLVTASLSICRKLTVITKTTDGDILTSIQDIDVIAEQNKFVKVLREANEKEKALFESFLKNEKSGTLLILSKCDQIQDKSVDSLLNSLRKSLAQIFRLFLDAGKEIVVGNESIKAFDPLMLNHKDTKIISDETFTVNTDDGNKESIQVKIVMLPGIKSTEAELAYNIRNQGFYVMRNNREIAGGVTLDVFTKHNRYNRFRAEIFFNGKLDNEMRIEFTKRDLRPKQSILQEIKGIVTHQLAYFEKEVKREQIRQKDQEEIHELSARGIKEKSTLLAKPEVKIEKRSPRKNHPGASEPTNTGDSRHPINSQELKKYNTEVEFQVREMGVGGVLFEADQIGKKTLITYNSEHPFYYKVFIENDDDNVKKYIDFLVYSLATAKLKIFNDDEIERIENFMSIFASNLRVLMK
jgi:hypothetical protein